MSEFHSYSALAGCKLKQLRKEAGYTSAEFAKLSGCKSSQQLYRYEKGAHKIDLDTLVSALKVLSVDIGIFMENLTKEGLDKHEKELIPLG